MNFCYNFPLFLIVFSLMSAVISSVLPRKGARILSMALPLLSAVANTALFFALKGQAVTYIMGHFPHPWGNEIRISPMESIFSACFSLILFLILLGGRKMVNDRVAEKRGNYFYVMTDLIQSALLVLVFTNDIFTGYVFIEICTLAGCGILMIRRNGKTTVASVRYMIFSLIGSGLFLFGVIFLYNITGHLLMPNLKEAVGQLWSLGEYRMPLLTAMVLITVGLAIKSGLCPFHLWMADTYGAAIPSASAILSGLISKGYIFFLIKVIFDVFGTEVFYQSGIQNVVLVMGMIGIVVGSIGALRENNILRMTAFSSAAQIGYIYMGIGLSATLGMSAALYHILVHAFTKPGVFLSAGILCDSMGDKKKFKNLQGAGFVNPIAGAAFTYEAFSMIGLPLTMGFISKYLFGVAAMGTSAITMIPALLVLAVSTILNTMYFARTILRIYTRSEGETPERIGFKAQKAFAIAVIALVVINLIFGVSSKPFITLLQEVVNVF